MEIHLVLNYRVPSLNVSLRQHWTGRHKGSQEAETALLNALESRSRDSSLDPKTLTIMQEAARRLSTNSVMRASSKVMNRGASSLKRTKKKSPTTAKKELKSP